VIDYGTAKAARHTFASLVARHQAAVDTRIERNLDVEAA
jgi:hypothetical protein